jgi:type IV secretion system protein VirB10
MTDDPGPADRLDSPVGAGGLRMLRTKTARTAAWSALGAVVLGCLVMIVKTSMDFQGPKTKPEDIGATKIAQAVPDPPVPEPVAPPEPAAPPPLTPAAFQPRQLVFVDPPPVTLAKPVAAAVPVNYVRFPTASSEGYFAVPASPVADKKPDAAGAAPGGKGDTLTSVAFKPTTIEGGQAGAAMDYTYKMLPQHIPCALDVAMDSSLPGTISCHTRVDVLSPMHVLLMPKGTLIQGDYKSNVQTGQQRLFAFAGTAYTPEGIPVPLNSTVADSLGRTGIPGEVDNHYPERFGAALALNLLEMGSQIVQSSLSQQGRGNSQTNFNFGGGGGGGSGSGVSSIANTILQHQIDIPPTIYVQPGAVITVVVDHIIDFSHAIKVTTR